MPIRAGTAVQMKSGAKRLMTMAMAMLSFAAISIVLPASSAGQGNCDPTAQSAATDDCTVIQADSAKNSQQSEPAPSASLPFKISVDGVATDGTQTDVDRKTDLGLDAVDIQVKFDGLDAKQILSVNTERPQGDVSTLRFRAHTNYAGFSQAW